MKILYLHQYFNTPEMPGSTRSYEMARRLAGAGHQVEMVTTSRRPSQRLGRGWQTTETAGFQVHWLHVPYANEFSYIKRLGAFLRFAVGAAWKAASLPGEVLFATSTPLTIALPAVFAARWKRIPLVFEVRDLWPAVPIAVGALRSPLLIAAARWLERFAYRHSERIIALSPGMKRGVVQAGFPEERVAVIPNSADLELFNLPAVQGEKFRSRYAWLRNRPLVVYTGTIGHINGVSYLVKLAKLVSELDPEVRFAVIGSGKEEALVRRKAQHAGVLGKNFFLLDPVPKKTIPEVLSAADLTTSLVIDNPALWDNSANKFFDALAAGTPIAINYRGWQADLIREHDCGLVLDPDPSVRSARRLAAALRDPAWLKRAGQAARNLGEKQFSRDLLAGQLEEVLCEAAGSARGSCG